VTVDSRDLPITESWDPDWDVYDVPIFGWEDVPVDIWWACYEHCAWIEWIMTGRTWGWPEGLLARQLTTGAYPGQPAQRSEKIAPSCRCFYQVRYAPVVLPPNGPHGRARRVTVLDHRFFTITPYCPQHGDAARISDEACGGADPAYLDKLDEDERRDH
jgi:hypothetical protein